jgi:hypothetical protein
VQNAHTILRYKFIEVKLFHQKKKPGNSWVYVRQYCAKIDEAARNRMELIVPELAKRNGVTEKLKADTKWNGYGR